MSISGLSNQLCLVVSIIITLLVGSSLFRSACATTDSHEFSDSRQFKRNLAVSRYRNNTYWMPNYSWKPLEKSDEPRKRPIWESKQEVVSEEEKKKRALFNEWDRKMRQVTKEQRNKWKTWDKDENISFDKTSVSSNEDFAHTTEVTEPRISVTDRLEDSSFEGQNTLHNGQWVAADTPTDSMNANSNRYNSKIPIEKSIFRKDRWGMSVREPPKEFLNEISRKSNSLGSNFPSNQKHHGSLKKPLDTKEITTTQPSVVVTFPPGRWGIGNKEPPAEFLKEIGKKLLTLKINSKAEEENKNEGSEKNTKFYDTRDGQGHRKSMGTGGTSMELPMGSSNGQWSMSKSSSPREFLRGIQTHDNPETMAFYKPTSLHQPVVDQTHDPRFQQLTPFQHSLLYKMLLLPQSPGMMNVPMVPKYQNNPRIFDPFGNPIVPGMRCVICQT